MASVGTYNMTFLHSKMHSFPNWFICAISLSLSLSLSLIGKLLFKSMMMAIEKLAKVGCLCKILKCFSQSGITFAFMSQNYKGTKSMQSTLLHRHLLKRTTFNTKTHHFTTPNFSIVDIKSCRKTFVILSATTFKMFYKRPLWYFYFLRVWLT